MSKNQKSPKLNADLRELVRTNAECYGDKILYIYKENGEEKTVSYNENWNRMNALGTAFSRIGLMGETVAVIGEAHPMYMTAYYAVTCGGGVIVPMDHDLSDDQLASFMELSEAKAIVYTKGFNHRLTAMADKMPGCRLFIPISPDEEEAAHPLTQTMDELIAMGQAGRRRPDLSGSGTGPEQNVYPAVYLRHHGNGQGRYAVPPQSGLRHQRRLPVHAAV